MDTIPLAHKITTSLVPLIRDSRLPSRSFSNPLIFSKSSVTFDSMDSVLFGSDIIALYKSHRAQSEYYHSTQRNFLGHRKEILKKSKSREYKFWNVGKYSTEQRLRF